MQPVGYFFDWFETIVTFKDPKKVYFKSFEMNQQQNIGSNPFMLDGWEVCLYTNTPSIQT